MSPWEIVYPGGSVEHNNPEPGQLWMERMGQSYDKLAWINPVPEAQWEYTQSIEILRSVVENKMFPLTVKGLERAMTHLAK